MEIEVIYHSVATGNLTDEQILDLVKKAQTNNKRSAITGCLLYHNGEFVQALEGEEKYIDELLKKIESDTRHKEMHILYRGTCENRSYESWSMAYDKLSNSDLKNIESVMDMQGFETLHSLKESPSRAKKIFTYLSRELKKE